MNPTEQQREAAADCTGQNTDCQCDECLDNFLDDDDIDDETREDNDE